MDEPPVPPVGYRVSAALQEGNNNDGDDNQHGATATIVRWSFARLAAIEGHRSLLVREAIYDDGQRSTLRFRGTSEGGKTGRAHRAAD
jgi:hypothetical protein